MTGRAVNTESTLSTIDHCQMLSNTDNTSPVRPHQSVLTGPSSPVRPRSPVRRSKPVMRRRRSVHSAVDIFSWMRGDDATLLRKTRKSPSATSYVSRPISGGAASATPHKITFEQFFLYQFFWEQFCFKSIFFFYFFGNQYFFNLLLNKCIFLSFFGINDTLL